MSKINDNVLFDPFSVEIEESDEISEALDYTDILVEVSRALVNYRKKQSLTQKQLSKILNMKQSMISKLESGEYNATLKMLLKISYTLEKDSSLFLDIIENIKKVLIRKKQYNEINLKKDYIYKVMNNNTKTYYFKDYTLINFEKQKNELNYSYKIC